jgi:hypothetical protein
MVFEFLIRRVDYGRQELASISLRVGQHTATLDMKEFLCLKETRHPSHPAAAFPA